MTRPTSRALVVVAGIGLAYGLIAAATATAQYGEGVQQRQQDLERPSQQEAADLGDQRQRELERGPNRQEQLEAPSRRQNDDDFGDERQQELEDD